MFNIQSISFADNMILWRNLFKESVPRVCIEYTLLEMLKSTIKFPENINISIDYHLYYSLFCISVQSFQSRCPIFPLGEMLHLINFHFFNIICNSVRVIAVSSVFPLSSALTYLLSCTSVISLIFSLLLFHSFFYLILHIHKPHFCINISVTLLLSHFLF